MALSGQVKTGSKADRYYVLDWTATQSIPNNQTTISWTFKAAGASGWVTEHGLDVVIDGANVYHDGDNNRRRYPGTIATGTKVITHTDNGTRSVTMSITAKSIAGTKTLTAESTFTLDTIPRASVVNSSTGSITVNGSNAIAISWTPYVASYTHKVKWVFGSYSKESTIAAGTNSASYAIPKDWLRAIPSAKSGTGNVTLTTYYGSTQIGSATTRSFTLNCAGNETPSFSISTADSAGIMSKIGCYVVGKSKIQVSCSSLSYQYGASLKSIAYTIGSYTSSGTATSATSTSFISGTSTAITVVLTDSRGYTATRTATITAYNYSMPSLGLSINRYHLDGSTYTKDDEGEYGRVQYTSSISNIGSNSIQSISISWAAADGTGTGSRSFTASTGDFYTSCDTEKVVNFTASITDKLNTVTYRKQLSSAVTIMDIISGGDGICFGGVASKHDALDFKLPSYFPRGLQTDYMNTTGADEVAMVKAKLDAIPDDRQMYMFPGGWSGQCWGFSVGYSDNNGNVKGVLVILTDGRVYVGYKNVSQGYYSIKKTTLSSL